MAKTPKNVRSSRSRSLAIAGAALVAFTLVAYWPAYRAGFVWDDGDYVARNADVADPGGLGRIWLEPARSPQYYPLVFSSFWAEWRAWGAAPAGYHVDNVLLHGANAVLLWLLLRQLDVPAAWLAAAVFAVHPVEVESVAWVTERKNVLSGFFYLSAMLVYLNGRGDELRLPRRASYFAALGLFVCALLSKTVAATWPGAVLVLMGWKRGRVDRRDVGPLVPFFAVGLVMACVTAALEHSHVGAVGKAFERSPIDRCLIAGRALWFYAGKIVFPHRLTFIYPRWDLHAHRPAQAMAALAAAGVLAALLALRRRIGRGPAAAGLLFAGTLLPALGFVNVYPMRFSYVADHFQYLASIALIAPAAAALVSLAVGRHAHVGRAGGRRAAGDPRATSARAAWLAPIVLAPLVVLTWRQCGIYRDAIALWTDTVAKNGGSWMTHENLGHAYEAAGRLNEAEAEYWTAARAEPDESDAWLGLGAFEAGHGKPIEAEAHYRRVIALGDDDPHVHYNLAKALLDPTRPGGPRTAEAISELRAVVRRDARAITPLIDMGWALLKMGRNDEAAEAFAEALAMAPRNTSARRGWEAARAK